MFGSLQLVSSFEAPETPDFDLEIANLVTKQREEIFTACESFFLSEKEDCRAEIMQKYRGKIEDLKLDKINFEKQTQIDRLKQEYLDNLPTQHKLYLEKEHAVYGCHSIGNEENRQKCVEDNEILFDRKRDLEREIREKHSKKEKACKLARSSSSIDGCVKAVQRSLEQHLVDDVESLSINDLSSFLSPSFELTSTTTPAHHDWTTTTTTISTTEKIELTTNSPKCQFQQICQPSFYQGFMPICRMDIVCVCGLGETKGIKTGMEPTCLQ